MMDRFIPGWMLCAVSALTGVLGVVSIVTNCRTRKTRRKWHRIEKLLAQMITATVGLFA